MEDMLGTIISETEGYRPVIYGVMALIVLGLIRKATKRWLSIDISPEGGLLGLVLLIIVIGIVSLAMDGKEISPILAVMFGLSLPALVAVASNKSK